MAAHLEDRVLDNGLSVLSNEATHLNICGTEPTTFTEATVTFQLGYKAYAAGGVVGAPTAASPNGEKVTSNAITDGTVAASGTANWWAITDNTNSRLLAVGALSSQAVLSGVTFTLGPFDIRIPAS